MSTNGASVGESTYSFGIRRVFASSGLSRVRVELGLWVRNIVGAPMR